MKIFIRLIAIYPLLVSMAFAAGGPQHEGGMNGMEAQGDGKQGGMMMNHQKMMSMNEHMQSMQEMMKNLKQESNPEKRSQLIDAHMQAMKGMMNDYPEDGSASLSIDQRMDMMNKHMNMMQTMMGQMMDSMIEARKDRPKHLKK